MAVRLHYPGMALPSPRGQLHREYLSRRWRRAGLHPKIYGNDLSWKPATYDPYPPAPPPPIAGDRLALLLRLPDCDDPAPRGPHPGWTSSSDECSPEIRSRRPGIPDLVAAELASAISRVERRPRSEGRPIQARQFLPGVHGHGHDRRADTHRHPSSRVLPARPSKRVREPGAVRIDSLKSGHLRPEQLRTSKRQLRPRRRGVPEPRRLQGY